MPAVGVVAIAAGLAVVAMAAPRRIAFGALVAGLLLLPAPLVVPNGLTPLPTVGRVVLVAAAAGLAWRIARGEIDAAVLRLTPAHAALGVFAIVALVVGVGMATATTPLGGSMLGWVSVVEHLLIFVVGVAWVRSFDDAWQPARIVAGVVLAVVAVAVVERLTGRSWGQWWFADLASEAGTDAAAPLESRGGQLRVRGPAEFALEFAWMLTALLPLLIAVAVHARSRGRRLLLGGAAAMAAVVVVWTVTRSASAVLVGVVPLATALVARRRTVVVVGVLALVTAVVVVLAPGVLGGLSLSVDTGSLAVRSQRLPEILQLASGQPLTGLGLSGLDAFGFPTTDAAYLLTYAELGVLGLSALVSMLALALVQVGRAALQPGPERPLVAAALLGMMVLIVGAWTYDAFSVLLSARTFWLLAAVGTVAAERAVGVLAPVAPWRPARLVVPAGLVIAGLLVMVSTSAPAVLTLRFQTLTPADETAGFDPVSFGAERVQVVCTLVTHAVAADDRVGADCRDPIEGSGIGQVRFEGATAEEVATLVNDIASSPAATLLPFALIPESPLSQALPTPWRTAPIWMGLAGAELAALLPLSRKSRELGQDLDAAPSGGLRRMDGGD